MLADIIGQGWSQVLQKEFDSDYMKKLSIWLQNTRQSRTIYPDGPDVFRALKLCPFGQVKVVIIGKEPYPQPDVADGLAFSYKNGLRMPGNKQSLDVILDEIEQDCYDGFNVNRDYQLDYLAKQGVLLLNSVLTVFKGQVDSHKGIGWERLTTKIIETQIIEKSPKVFLLWGKDAQNIFHNAKLNISDHEYGYLDGKEHEWIENKHPAYDLHKRDQFGNITVRYPEGFTGCKCFSQTNKFLITNRLTPINWFNTHEPYNNVSLNDDNPPF